MIVVNNSVVVSDYLGFPVRLDEDLLKNEKCQDFIKENELYFTSVDQQDFLDFYAKTGIILEHAFLKGRSRRINLFGLVEENPHRVHIAHLVILDDENSLRVEDDTLYLNDKEVRNVKAELEEQRMRFEKFERFNAALQEICDYPEYYSDFNKSKEELIRHSKEYFPDYKEIENTKQLVVTPYNDVLALTDDGTLYCNNKVYRTGVYCIFEENSYSKALIYRRNYVEYLTAEFGGPLGRLYNTILCNPNCLATLVDKKLHVVTKLDEYILDDRNEVDLEGIDEIHFNDAGDIEIIVGKEKIVMPIF